MYICLCHGITDKTIQDTIRKKRPNTLKDLRRLLPIGNQCGKCLICTKQLFEKEKCHLIKLQRVA